MSWENEIKEYRKLKGLEVDAKWDDCTMGVSCLCGNNEEVILVDSQNGIDADFGRCSACGRHYVMSYDIYVKEM